MDKKLCMCVCDSDICVCVCIKLMNKLNIYSIYILYIYICIYIAYLQVSSPTVSPCHPWSQMQLALCCCHHCQYIYTHVRTPTRTHIHIYIHIYNIKPNNMKLCAHKYICVSYTYARWKQTVTRTYISISKKERAEIVYIHIYAYLAHIKHSE